MSCVELVIVVLLVGGEGKCFSRELESLRSCVIKGIFGRRVEVLSDGEVKSSNKIYSYRRDYAKLAD